MRAPQLLLPLVFLFAMTSSIFAVEFLEKLFVESNGDRKRALSALCLPMGQREKEEFGVIQRDLDKEADRYIETQLILHEIYDRLYELSLVRRFNGSIRTLQYHAVALRAKCRQQELKGIVVHDAPMIARIASAQRKKYEEKECAIQEKIQELQKSTSRGEFFYVIYMKEELKKLQQRRRLAEIKEFFARETEKRRVIERMQQTVRTLEESYLCKQEK